jgi:hypothetical protein
MKEKNPLFYTRSGVGIKIRQVSSESWWYSSAAA